MISQYPLMNNVFIFVFRMEVFSLFWKAFLYLFTPRFVCYCSFLNVGKLTTSSDWLVWIMFSSLFILLRHKRAVKPETVERSNTSSDCYLELLKSETGKQEARCLTLCWELHVLSTDQALTRRPVTTFSASAETDGKQPGCFFRKCWFVFQLLYYEDSHLNLWVVCSIFWHIID